MESPIFDIESYLAPKFEGKLFAFISLTYCLKDYSIRRVLRTVKEGLVYEVQTHENNNLYPTGDKLLDLETKCHKIGIFDPSKNYKVEQKNFTYSELRKLLKTKNSH